MLANPSLKCLTPADVYLLLKSSDFVTHSLSLSEHTQESRHELVLKKWFDMPRSSEWRAFVRNKRLIGELLLCLVGAIVAAKTEAI